MKSLLLNKVSFKNEQNYSAILGINPSKGARSPLLWNAAFKALKFNIRMYSFDVSKENFFKLLQILINDKHFIGGSIAVPYKEMCLNFKEIKILPQAKIIGAVNTLFRNKKGELCATNTDGYAAIQSLKNNNINFKRMKKILILGCGGAGKAVSAYISKELKNTNNKLTIAVRNKSKYSNFGKQINAKIIFWDERSLNIDKYDLIINTTSIGFRDKQNSPLKLSDIKKIKKNILIYDIIYDPIETKLIKYAKQNNIKTINGLEMNLLQAVIAFAKANNIANFKNIKNIMKNV